MKKFILLSILFLFSITSIKSQVYKFIPDPDFRAFLVSEGYPFDVSGDSLNISAPSVTNLTTMNCYGYTFGSIEGIQYFTSLTHLDLSYCQLPSIDTLPDSLEYLEAEYNPLVSLPVVLPPNLKYMLIGSSYITNLPNLPNSLEHLIINGDANLIGLPILPTNLIKLFCNATYNFSSLPALPSGLDTLDCGYTNITSLPTLPSGLKYLSCDLSNISIIPTLPSGLKYISCRNLSFASLPILPSGLEHLDCSYNTLLSSLPTLPLNLRTLFMESVSNLNNLPTLPSGLLNLICDYTPLTSLPTLPSGLNYLDCRNCTSLSCLPFLPNSLTSIQYLNSGVTCIPNLVAGASYSPPIGTFPFCNPLVNSCPSYIAVSGTTYADDDVDCTIDSIEHRIPNISLVLQNNATVTQRVSTFSNGIYGFNAIPSDTYTVHVDTLESPFTLSCISSGYDTIYFDSLSMSFTDRNYAMHCKPGFDIGTSGLLSTSLIRPATTATFDLHAGDMSTIYGIHCTSIAGKISIDYSGPMHYTGVSIGTLLPDSILPNRLVWNIADFSTLDFNSAIKPNFYVDSTAIIGSLVCFTTNITPTVGDRIPTNNSITQCFTVRASYDPNIKEVSPSGTITASQDWLYYTIHFQNTGNSYAQNIYVWDTIDPNLNLNTIQVLSASHDQFMNVFNNNRSVRFNFLNINLSDSTTNEAASHGWVQYRIKPNASLAEGIQIRNTASILFDLNAPVVTNTVTNRICNSPTAYNQTYTITSGQHVRVGTHIYTNSGVYTDVLSNMNGCDSTINTILHVVAGIEDLNPLRIIMYPNPTNHEVMIQLEGNTIEPVSVIDMYGRNVFTSERISNKYIINTENWSNGTYVVQCGNHRAKLVVSH